MNSSARNILLEGLVILFLFNPAGTLLRRANAQSVAPTGTNIEKRSSSNELRPMRAQLIPRRFATLASEVAAKVSSIALTEGSRFDKGQLLISFDCTLQAAQLRKAKAALESAEATWQGNRRLLELNSIGRVELDVSLGEVRKNRAEVESMEAVISKCEIRAPFSGQITELKVSEHQYVQQGQPVLEIIDDGVLEVQFIAPSHWLAWLRPGLRFLIKIEENLRTYTFRLERIGARADPVTQTVKVSGLLDRKSPELIAGMTGMVKLDDKISQP